MKNFKLAVLMILALVLTGFAAYAEPALSDSVAVVSKFSGSGYVNNTGAWNPVAVGMPVYEGDTIVTKNDSSVEIAFDSATLVRVDADSQLKISELKRNENAARTIFNLIKGRIVAIVDHLKNPESAFEVHTKMAIAAVKGTELAVEEGALGVFEGSVAYSNADGSKSVQVGLGNESEVTSPDGVPSIPAELKKLLHIKAQLNVMREDVNVFRNLRNTHLNIRDYIIQKQKTGAKIAENRSPIPDADRKTHNLLADRTRKELRYARAHAASELGYVNAQMQSDLHLGKTMTDVHGNRIRMEEYLLRPDPREVDLLSMTMRDKRIDYLHVLNTFNTALPAEIPKSAWSREWDMSPAAPNMPPYYRLNQTVKMSNGGDEVEFINTYGYEVAAAPSVAGNTSGRTFLAQPIANMNTGKYDLLDYEYSLLINNSVKEHKRNVFMQVQTGLVAREWIRLEDDKTFTSIADLNTSLSELVSPNLPAADQVTAANAIITQTLGTNMGVALTPPITGSLMSLTTVSLPKVFTSDVVTQLRLSDNLDLAASTTRTYNDGSNLMLRVYLINDYGKIQTRPSNLSDWFNLAYNTNVELQLNSNQFVDQGLGIDVVSKLLWWVAINPKNANTYNTGSTVISAQ